MHKIKASWIKVGVIALLLFIQVAGCDIPRENQIKAAGIGAAGAGSILVSVPDPWGICFITGVTLIAGGTICCVTMELQDGTSQQVEVPLTQDQIKAVKAGATVHVQ